MDIKKVTVIYFSPNGSTKKIVNKVAEDIGGYTVEEIDLTSVESRNKKRKFSTDELVVIGFPVYADRLPVVCNEIFKNIEGNNTPTIAIVSYGNRDYGDALLELTEGLKKSNMKVISGAAIIGKHCLNNNVATNRPDKEDNIKISEYANKIRDKINNIVQIEETEDIYVKGSYPYKPLKSHMVPIGDLKCIQCGLCEEKCPANAIDKKDFRQTNDSECIFCGACINICPTNARDIKEESFKSFMKKLETIAKERKEIETFIR
ncbi:EFR1 family ferrodoxin [Clostridium sp.]|uniref:EFR1 family ferrodoxin n=1 Tax=Clostridium sp. TaxID=1506 RepID=UPI001A45A680|nr:EFR1 family ferrodoxin [Clostridium sp.]MBK5241100.1 EFR1 family ferrodoxin [Clostridium sp.]